MALRRALALACALLMVASAAAYLTDAEIEGMLPQCAAGVYANGWSNEDCTDCMEAVGSSLWSNKTYACATLCGSTPGSQFLCQQCLLTPGASVEGCKQCLDLEDGDDQAACIYFLTAGPDDDLPDWYTATYQAAVPGCFLIPGGPLRTACLNCLMDEDSSSLETPNEYIARLKYGTPEPAQDMGKCVWYWRNEYNVTADPENAEGEYTLCLAKPDNAGMTQAECMACMSTAEWDFTVNSTGGMDFPVVSKAYGCSAYCQDPAYNGGDSAAAALCSACLADDDSAATAYGCGLCTKLPLGSAGQGACFQCIAEGWYEGNADNVEWACAQCGSITNADLRSACFACITSQEGAEDGEIDDFTISNICECVSQTKTLGLGLDYALGPLEQSCFEPWINREAMAPGDDDVFFTIPWGDEEGKDEFDFPLSKCIRCQEAATTKGKYACHDVCQDPRLVITTADGDNCAACVENHGDHPEACKMCMETTRLIEDDGYRLYRTQQCQGCTQSMEGWQEGMAVCNACAGLSNGEARCACYECAFALDGDEENPWDLCVTTAKNGTNVCSDRK